MAAQLENYYDIQPEDDLEEYENEGFEEIYKNEEFSAELEGEE